MATSKNPIFQRNYKGTLGYELPDFEHQLFEISSLPLFDAEVYHQLFVDDDEWEQDLTELLRVLTTFLRKCNISKISAPSMACRA